MFLLCIWRRVLDRTLGGGQAQSLTLFRGARFGQDNHEPPLHMFVSEGPSCSPYCSYRASPLHSIQLRQLRQLRQKAVRGMKRRKLFSMVLSWYQNVSGREGGSGRQGRFVMLRTPVMLNEVKHRGTQQVRPFATLRVTRGGRGDKGTINRHQPKKSSSPSVEAWAGVIG